MKNSTGLVVILFLSIFVFGITNVSTLTTAANTTIAPTFGVSAERLAALSTAYFLAFVLIAPLCGFLADIFGRKRLVLAGGTFLAIGLLLFGFCRHLMLGEIAQFIIGTGGIILQVVATATVSDIYRENPARALNLSQVFFGAGAFVSPTLVGYLLSSGNVPWPGIYFGAAILVVLLVFGLMTQTFPATAALETASQEGAPAAGGVGGLFLSGTFLALVLAMLAYGCAEMGTGFGVPPYLEKGLDATKSIAGLSLSWYWGLMTVGRLVGTGIPKKASYPAIIAWSCIAGGICLGIASSVNSVLVAGLLFSLMGLSIAVVWPTILADARRRIERHSATAFGIIIGAGGLGAMLYPLVVGRLAENTGEWHIAMRSIVIPIAVLLLVFALFYAVDRARARRANP